MTAWRYAGIPNQMTFRTPHNTHPVPDTMAFRVDRWSLFDQSQPCWNRSTWPVCLPKFPEKHRWKPWECTLQCANAAENKSTLHALASCLNSKLLGPKSNFLLFKSPFHQFFHVLKRGEYLFSVCPKILSWQTWNLPSSWAEVTMAFNIQIEVGSSKPWNNYWHSTMGYSYIIVRMYRYIYI